MAKISELPVATSVTGTETFPIVQSGTTKQSTLDIVKTWFNTLYVQLTNLAASSGSSLVGFIQSGTGSVATDVQTELRRTIWINQYGASPSASAAVNTAAIQAACVVLAGLGGGTLKATPGIYNFTSPIAGTVYAFSNLTGFSLVGSGVTFNDQSTYTTGQTSIFFSFTACNNIHIDPTIKFTSQHASATDNTMCIEWFKFLQGCTNVTGGAVFSGGLYGFHFFRNSGDPVTYISSDLTLDINASYVYYPMLCERSGNSAIVTIETLSCGRSYYAFGNGDNSTITIHAKNQIGASGLSSDSGGTGAKNVTIKFIDNDSDSNNASNSRLILQYYNQTPATFENIHFDINVTNPVGSPFFETLTINKFDNSQVSDTVGRGHVLRNLKITGKSAQVNSREHIIMYGAFASTDVVDNITIGPFVGSGAGSQVILTLGNALTSTVKCDQLVLLDDGVGITHSTGKTIFTACTVKDGALSTADTSIQDYIACDITNGSLLSYINRSFFDTAIAGVPLTSYRGRYRKITGNVAANAVLSLTPPGGSADVKGILTLLNSAGAVGLFSLQGANHATAKISDPNANYSITAGTAGSNIYWSAGNARYELENKTGSSSENYEFEILYRVN